MDDEIFVLIMMTMLIATAIWIIRGARQSLTTEERQKIADLSERVKVLEQIVTDGGATTAAQIEALRDPPRQRLID